MSTILITGSTDGIGLETAHHLAGLGHRLVLHGRDPAKLEHTRLAIEAEQSDAVAAEALADLSNLTDVDRLATATTELGIDVVVNNAGVFRTSRPITDDGLDVRFVVNTIAPYLLTRRLLATLPADGRVINLSSAAQAPVDLDALAGLVSLDGDNAYAQSKLALTMWSRHLADQIGQDGPAIIAVNPGSLLATKMVKEGYGIAGNDIRIGADILTRASLSDEFADATGRYFDNDAGRFGQPHPDALDPNKNAAIVAAIDDVLSRITTS
ncbi:MAG: SDR family NAD(P)-dependent oxidoreductase [Acidimicrobiales bacterium]